MRRFVEEETLRQGLRHQTLTEKGRKVLGRPVKRQCTSTNTWGPLVLGPEGETNGSLEPSPVFDVPYTFFILICILVTLILL